MRKQIEIPSSFGSETPPFKTRFFSEKSAPSIVARVETNGSVPDSAFGARVGCAVPPSRCQLPERKAPGWRALGFPPELWAAPTCLPGALMVADKGGRRRNTTIFFGYSYHCNCGYQCHCSRGPGSGGFRAIGLNG